MKNDSFAAINNKTIVETSLNIVLNYSYSMCSFIFLKKVPVRNLRNDR